MQACKSSLAITASQRCWPSTRNRPPLRPEIQQNTKQLVGNHLPPISRTYSCTRFRLLGRCCLYLNFVEISAAITAFNSTGNQTVCLEPFDGMTIFLASSPNNNTNASRHPSQTLTDLTDV